MTNLKPRIRLIDLNELEKRRVEHSKNSSTPWASLYAILIEDLSDPQKTKDDLIKKIVG